MIFTVTCSTSCKCWELTAAAAAAARLKETSGWKFWCSFLNLDSAVDVTLAQIQSILPQSWNQSQINKTTLSVIHWDLTNSSASAIRFFPNFICSISLNNFHFFHIFVCQLLNSLSEETDLISDQEKKTNDKKNLYSVNLHVWDFFFFKPLPFHQDTKSTSWESHQQEMNYFPSLQDALGQD